MNFQKIAQLGRRAAVKQSQDNSGARINTTGNLSLGRSMIPEPLFSGTYLPKPANAIVRDMPAEAREFETGIYNHKKSTWPRSRSAALESLSGQASPAHAQNYTSPVAQAMTARRYGGQVPVPKVPKGRIGVSGVGIPGTEGVDEQGYRRYGRYGTLGVVRQLPGAAEKTMYMSSPEDVQKILKGKGKYRDLKPDVDYMSRFGVINHEAEHLYNQPARSVDPSKNTARYKREHDDYRSTSETAPAIGDIVFGGEKFRQEEGRQPQHMVRFPGGKEHDINWMVDQAKQHGYFQGRSMQDLIFNTQAGRQWYKQNLENIRRARE